MPASVRVAAAPREIAAWGVWMRPESLFHSGSALCISSASCTLLHWSVHSACCPRHSGMSGVFDWMAMRSFSSLGPLASPLITLAFLLCPPASRPSWVQTGSARTLTVTHFAVWRPPVVYLVFPAAVGVSIGGPCCFKHPARSPDTSSLAVSLEPAASTSLYAPKTAELFPQPGLLRGSQLLAGWVPYQDHSVCLSRRPRMPQRCTPTESSPHGCR